MEDGAEGSVEAAHVEAVVGVSSGGSHGGWSRRRRSEGEGSRYHHGGWRQGSVEDGGVVAAVDLEKGAAAVVEEGGGRALAPSRPRVRRPRFWHPRIIAGELYSQRQATSRRHRQ
jgi:hypothetical protein